LIFGLLFLSIAAILDRATIPHRERQKAEGGRRQSGFLSKRKIVICICLTGVAAILLTNSCSGPTMRSEFRSYNTAYADALNHQMLLNLARLENGHPAYYLAIGSITNRFIDTATANAGSTGAFTSTDNSNPFHAPASKLTTIASFPSRIAQTVLGYSGGGAYTHTKNPDFQFIPINNEAVARQILDPVLPDVFLTLYNQGYPIDQLMRVMIERVETTLPGGEELTLINSPGSGAAAKSFARFLRACAILREMQRLGYLSLISAPKTESLGPISFDTPNNGGRTNPTAKEFAEAEKAGYELVQVDDPDPTKGKRWEIIKKRSTTIFVLKSPEAAADAIRGLSVDSRLQPMTAATEEAMRRIVALLVHGISLQTKAGEARAAPAHLVLRSFDRSMKAVASEQPAFEEFRQSEQSFSIVPDEEQQPILQMMWNDKSGPREPPLQTIHYSGKTYEITDPMLDPLNPRAHWNRDVFRLLVALNSQVTVDISKFQQQTIQLLPSAQ
jgi:hypothetical protein